MNETFLSEAGATVAFSLTANNQAGSKAENEVGSHFKTPCSESIHINGLQRVLPNGFKHCISSFKCSAAKVTVQTLSERIECKLTASFKHVLWLRSPVHDWPYRMMEMPDVIQV